MRALTAAAAVLVLAAFLSPLAAPAPAAAAVIVDNTAGVDATNVENQAFAGIRGGSSSDRWLATAFTTGTLATGYTLTSVQIAIATAQRPQDSGNIRLRVTTPTSTNTGIPDLASSAVIATLTGPGVPASGSQPVYTADNRPVLRASTTYYLVVDYPKRAMHNLRDIGAEIIVRGEPDTTMQASRDGWTIADDHIAYAFRNSACCSWGGPIEKDGPLWMRISVQPAFPAGSSIDDESLSWGLPLNKALPFAGKFVDYSITPAMPNGLTLNSGTIPPTITGTANPTDANGNAISSPQTQYSYIGNSLENTSTGPLTFNLGVGPPFAHSGNYPGGVIGDLTFTQGVDPNLGLPGYGGTLVSGSASYAITGRALPAGLGFGGGGAPNTRGSTPDLQGTPTEFQRQESYTYEIDLNTAGATNPTQQFTITVLPAPPTAAIAAVSGTYAAGARVQLNGSASTGGYTLNHNWSQSGGPNVMLSGANSAQASFTAPVRDVASALAFELTVTDSLGRTAADTVNVNVAASQALIMALAAADAAEMRLDGARMRLARAQSDAVTLQRLLVRENAYLVTVRGDLASVNAEIADLRGPPAADIITAALEAAVAQRVDINGDGVVDADDFLIVYYAEVHAAELGSVQNGVFVDVPNGAANRARLLGGMRGAMPPGDAGLQMLLLRADALRAAASPPP